MLNRRAASFAMLLLGAVVFGALAGSGCAIHRGDRNTVQPLALDKKQFQGDWYYLTTVIKAPYDAVGMFPGAQSSMVNIRWEITERYLYAFTTQPSVRNADSTVVPIAAWPIIGHFTIRYRISYMTGQPSNVVGEDYIDRPWYQRPHFRVAWERSLVTDYTGSGWYYRMFGYYVREMPTNVRPEEVQMQSKFMDFVNEEVVSPGIWPLIGKLNSGMPVSAYRIRIRHSFKKIEKSTYTIRGMNDDQFGKFGYFRTALINYNMDRGLVDWSYQYVANRHNVATKAELDKYAADKTPEADQKPKQIVYYLSKDFPANMRDAAYQIGKDWNRAFQRATGRTDDVFVLRENGHGLPQGQYRNMGDVRYNFLYWVPEAISFGLLGYGPSFADFNTGEVVQASAYVYGATVRRVANRFLLLYDMVSGKYTDEDLRNGKDYLDIINNFTSGSSSAPLVSTPKFKIKKPAYTGFSVQRAHEYVQSPVFQQRHKMLQQVNRAGIQARLSMVDSKPSLKWAMMPDETLASMFPGSDLERLRKSQDQQVKDVLNSYMNPGNMMKISSIREISKQNDEFARRNVMLANFVDPAMSKFVQDHVKKGTSRDDLYTLMNAMIFRGTEAHEIGHTLGLRHNFTGSADEPNYFPKYKELVKYQGGNIPGADGHNEHAWFYMYSSIMDYHGDVYGDTVGIGTYDHAAIMYAYGNREEASDTFDETAQGAVKTYLTNVAEAMKKLNQAGNKYDGFFKEIKVTQNDLKMFDGPAFEAGKTVKMYDTTQVLLHVEGVDNNGDTKTIVKLTADDLSGLEKVRVVHSLTGIKPRSNTAVFPDGALFLQREDNVIKRRPYLFCSDELVGQDPYCNRFDSGSNPKMMVDNMIRRYDGYYPLRNWNRGRRYYRLTSGYFYGLISQFSLISIFYQNWMFRTINEDSYEGSQDYFNQLAAIERGITFINRVIQTPEPGRHVLDKITNTYVQSNVDSTDTVDVPIGVGRYFYSKLQEDQMGLAQYRFERIGTMYDKYVAMMTLAIRDWGLAANALNFFFVNFADFFSADDVTDIFTQGISGIFDNKRYSMTVNGKILQPNWHPTLQYTSMLIAVSMLNNGFFGNTFSHYMTVGITGSGQSWDAPKKGSVISFTNAANTRSYFAVQTEDGRSIAYKLVNRGNVLAKRVKELRSLPTSAVNQAELKTMESQLVWVETVLQMMKAYVNVFYEDN